MDRLRNKFALITGGSSGIGWEVARRFLEEGAKVLITGRNQEKLDKARQDLKALYPQFSQNIQCIALDGAKLDSVRAGIDKIKQSGEKIDILVNNAGSAGPMQTLSNIPLHDQELKDLQEKETLADAIGSLLGGTWYLTVALIPLLNPHASIINISTIFSKTEYYGRIAYVAPKAALNRLSHLMAEELGQIRINTVFPGPVQGERIEKVFSAMDKLKGLENGATSKQIASTMLLPSYLHKDEIANAILFLASDESTGITDQNHEVTHGLQVNSHDSIEIVVSPDTNNLNLNGHFVWILAGDQQEVGLALAQTHLDRGAEVLLTFRDKESVAAALQKTEAQLKFTIHSFDPTDEREWETLTKKFTQRMFYPNHIFALPQTGEKALKEHFGESLVTLPLEKIEHFLREIADSIAVARGLNRLFHSNQYSPAHQATIAFISNGSDGKKNKFAKIHSSAIHQMIRTWRHEESFYQGQGVSPGTHIWQLIRYENEEPGNLDVTCHVALNISAGTGHYPHIDITLSQEVSYEALKQYRNEKYNKLLGNLTNKVALITGGSEGIGRETARILLEGGARVILASRSREKLEKTREFFIKELELNGYTSPKDQVYVLECDVSDENSIAKAFQEVIEKFGRIDFLINNAGITGQEKSVVDISLEGWRNTLNANLISNYNLITHALPLMKQNHEGYIVNVSSQFGGMHFATPAYPNRADYAVTKAGQRALAEAFGGILGPDVLINAVAPGPVEGDRLRGGTNRSSLYYRRAKANLENMRTNIIYNALVEIWRETKEIGFALKILALNDIALINKRPDLPLPIQKALSKISKAEGGSSTHLLTKTLAERILTRLRWAHCLPRGYSQELFFHNFVEAPEPFFSEDEINQAASSILKKIMTTLSLGHMPTEYDIGREVALNITNRCITGETIYPSCGMTLEKFSKSSDWVGYFPSALYDHLQVKTVAIVGDAMYAEMALIAAAYSKGKSIQTISIIVGSSEGAHSVTEVLEERGIHSDAIEVKVVDLHSLDSILDSLTPPDILISMPQGNIPTGADWHTLPPLEQFKKIMEEQITHHFLMARRGSLFDHCRVFLITPSLNKHSSKLAIAFAQFIQSSLASLCATAAKEATRLTHQAVFYQINCNLNLDEEIYREQLIQALMTLSLPREKDSKLQTGAILTV